MAAQNCRKRKLDQILSLADEVKEMRENKHRLITERDFIVSERQRVKDKYAQLYRHVFQVRIVNPVIYSESFTLIFIFKTRFYKINAFF